MHFLLSLIAMFNAQLNVISVFHESATTQKFQLQNDFGTVSFFLPQHFDSIHTWDDRTDYSRGDVRIYRFQSSKEDMIEESGFVHEREPQNIFYVSVEHMEEPEANYPLGLFIYPEMVNSYCYAITNKRRGYDGSLLESIVQLRIINERPFVCITSTFNVNLLPFGQELQAHTVLNGKWIWVKIYNNKPGYSYSRFIKESNAILETVVFN